MDGLISVIVPVYNVEEYLPCCIESIIKQTYRNLEIIIVDDGSTDCSLKICQKYSEKDKRIHLYTKINGGLSSARNLGLDKANGDFVSFVDSDDWIELSMYETLIKNLLDSHADMAVCQIFNCDYKKLKKIPTQDDGKKIILKGFYTYLNYIFAPQKPEIRFEVWNKLYKKNLVNDIRFKNSQIFEDIYYTRKVLETAKSIVCINIPLYNYRVNRPGSTCRSFDISRLSKQDELNDIIKILDDGNHPDLLRKYVDYTMNTTLEFFCAANYFGGSEDEKKMICDRFNKYYEFCLNNDFIIHFKYRLFNFSHSLYYFFKKIKNIL